MNLQFQKLDSSANRTGDTTLPGSTCQVVLTEVGGPGGMVRGTFTAHTEYGTGTLDITGSFAAPVPGA